MMIRYILVPAILMLIHASLLGQVRTDRYCEVSFSVGRHLPDLKFDSSFLEVPLQKGDTTSTNGFVDILKQRGSVACVLNFMAARGWSLVSTTAWGSYTNERTFYFIKK